MKRLFLLMLIVATAHAQVRIVRGSVTYLASGSVYTSIGRNQGIEDSARIVIFKGSDTLAVLQVFAASSKSSVCRIITMLREPQAGDSVVAFVVPKVSVISVERAGSGVVPDSILHIRTVKDTSARTASGEQTEKSWITVSGRVGLQYSGLFFETSSLNANQPGIVAGLHGLMKGVPVKFDLYGTFRTSLTGSGNRSGSEMRLYRASLEYDDHTTMIMLGRIIPAYASGIGSVDGLSIARRVGPAIIGASAGAQPVISTRDPTSGQRKVVVFANYQSADEWNSNASGAYARSFSSMGIEREAVSASVSAYSPSGMSLYGTTDVDLRSPSSGGNSFTPGVSLLLISGNYRLTDAVSVGAGIDASRPVYTLSFAQSIPDSMLDKRLRTGITLSGNLSLFRGAGLYNTYMPRSGDEGFGAEYANTTMLYLGDILSSGVSIRLNFSVNNNAMSRVRGLGASLQRNIVGVDAGLRYQRSTITLKQLGMNQATDAFGCDAAVFLMNNLSFIGSYDLMKGLGETTQSVFAELSWRF